VEGRTSPARNAATPATSRERDATTILVFRLRVKDLPGTVRTDAGAGMMRGGVVADWACAGAVKPATSGLAVATTTAAVSRAPRCPAVRPVLHQGVVTPNTFLTMR
jgi:hypothetical protein